MLLDEELAEGPDRVTCRPHDKQNLQACHVENAASEALLVVTVEVLLLALILLVVYYCVHGLLNLVDALIDQFEAAFVHCCLVLFLLHCHVEVTIFFSTINHARLTVEEATFLCNSCASIY